MSSSFLGSLCIPPYLEKKPEPKKVIHLEKLITNEQMRQLEAVSDKSGVSYQELMAHAGTRSAIAIQKLAWKSNLNSIVFLAGKGNNGGDCFVAARFLKQHGFQVSIILAQGNPKTELATHAYENCVKQGVTVTDKLPQNFDILVDGIFGTGFHGNLPESVIDLFQQAQKISPNAFKIAMDIPSGGNGTTGAVAPHTFQADLTLTFGYKKVGLYKESLHPYCGEIQTIDIGFPLAVELEFNEICQAFLSKKGEILSYETLQKKMQTIGKNGIVPGLETISALCQALGNPQDQYTTIHIAGTNGKGSTGFFLQKLLTEKHNKVGHFSSPAIRSATETIQIDGTPISLEAYLSGLDHILEVAKEHNLHPTPFELETALAFYYFQQEQVDHAIIECGMGGKEDATNVIKQPALCILTSIDFDHKNFLGDTIEEITQQKCGIIKPNSKVLLAPNCETVTEIVKDTCNKIGAELFTLTESEIPTVEPHFQKNIYRYKSLSNLSDKTDTEIICYKSYNQVKTNDFSQIDKEDLLRFIKQRKEFIDCEEMGTVSDTITLKVKSNCMAQRINLCLAIKAMFILTDSIYFPSDLFENTDFFGRFSLLSEEPKIMIDGGHNAGAMQIIWESVQTYFPNQTYSLILGAYKDKDFHDAVTPLLTHAKEVFTIPTKGPRGQNGAELKQTLQDIRSDILPCRNVENALFSAIFANSDFILCCGSFSYLAEVEELIKNRKEGPSKRIYKILEHPKFRKNMLEISELEEDRIYCKHDFPHSITVADICLQICQEQGISVKKDVIYATALLHDTGRQEEYHAQGSHEEAGIQSARLILEECNYTEDEICLIQETIRNHRQKKNFIEIANFQECFAFADQLSRNCKNCDVYDSCNWSEELKQHTLAYLEGTI